MLSARISSTPRTGRTKAALLPFAALPLVLALASCGKEQPAAAPPAPVTVAVIKASTREVPVLIEAVGRTEGSKEVEVRARVSGILEKVNFTEGMQVKAGTPLFRIDPAPFEIALAQARACSWFTAARAGRPGERTPQGTGRQARHQPPRVR